MSDSVGALFGTPDDRIWPSTNPVGTSSLDPGAGLTPPVYHPHTEALRAQRAWRESPYQALDLSLRNADTLSFPGRVVAGALTPFTGLAAQQERALQGKEVDPQAVTPGMMAMAMPALGTPYEANVLRTFGSPRTAADRGALGMAYRLEQQGIHPEDIYKQTGWFRAADGNWKYEIGDQPLRVTWDPLTTVGPPPKDMPMRVFARHPTFYRSFPEIGDVPVRFDPTFQGGEAMYSFGSSPGQNLGLNPTFTFSATVPTPREAIVHELGHAVARLEGWQTGGSYNTAIEESRVLQPRIEAELALKLQSIGVRTPQEFAAHTGLNPVAAAQKYPDYIDSVFAMLKPKTQEGLLRDVARTIYHQLGGEVESRLFEKRLGLTPQQARERLPTLDYDVPREQQIFSVR